MPTMMGPLFFLCILVSLLKPAKLNILFSVKVLNLKMIKDSETDRKQEKTLIILPSLTT